MNDFDLGYHDDRSVFGDPYPELLAYLSARGPGRLLDLGCGQGRNAVALAALDYEVTAIDASAVGVDQTVRDATGRGLTVRGVVADLTDYPLRGSYAVVLVDMVLHGLDDDDRPPLLTAVRGAIAPGGTAYVVVPDPGPVVQQVTEALSPWPTTIQSIHHHLPDGEHAGDYVFTAVIGERPDG
jgi:SAM-dependent methyltransferase